MLFISIIWNYFEEIPIDICQYLNSYSPIQSISLLKPGSHFEEFIKDVYSCNDIKAEYITKKISDLNKLPNRIVLIIKHELSSSELVFNPNEKKLYSEKNRQLKENIRSDFNEVYHCIENAPIIHSTDNEVETLKLIDILDGYFKKCESEKIVLQI